MIKKKGQRKTQDPCDKCFLHKSLCICESIPSLKLKTKVVLVVHAKELKRTTNTGRLALHALSNSEMRIRGQEHQVLDLSDLIANTEYTSVLFYPTEDAQELSLEFVQSLTRPVQLIVPDGNWRQASKVHTRHPELKNIPRVKISQPNTSAQHLRAEHTPEGMATLQAIAEALGTLESHEAKTELLKLYQLKLNRTLIGRGILDKE